MVTKHKIHVDFYDDTFTLLAIHSSLDDHVMAFRLNQSLNTQLRRKREDLSLGADTVFPVFEWEDQWNDRYWSVIRNTCQSEQENQGADLFQNEISEITHYLIPERKDVDYFLKIAGDESDLSQDILEKLSQIPQVITSYSLDPKTLKSIENIMY